MNRCSRIPKGQVSQVGMGRGEGEGGRRRVRRVERVKSAVEGRAEE